MLISQATLLVLVLPVPSVLIFHHLLVSLTSDSVVLFKLTVVTNTRNHFTAASFRKRDCYGPLLHDLQDSIQSVDLVTIEIGCLGQFCQRQ